MCGNVDLGFGGHHGLLSYCTYQVRLLCRWFDLSGVLFIGVEQVVLLCWQLLSFQKIEIGQFRLSELIQYHHPLVCRVSCWGPCTIYLVRALTIRKRPKS
jgi:hypothetical protein